MTPEQESRCAALAKRIAALRPDWAVPGVACRDPDPEDATIWRRVENYTWHGASVTDFLSWMIHDDESAMAFKECASLRDAIANGPDWRDAATLGALLMHYLPKHWLIQDGVSESDWLCGARGHVKVQAPTRTEAILAAVVAALGGGEDGSV